MLIINNVYIKPDNIEESVSNLDDLIKSIARHFPNIEVMPEDDSLAITFSIVTYLVDKTDIDYGRDDFKDNKKFSIVTSLTANAITNEINEYITISKDLFISMYKTLMSHKFRFLYGTRYMINDVFSKEHLFNNKIMEKLSLNEYIVLQSYNKIKNS